MRHCASCGSCFDDQYDLCAADGQLLVHSLPGERILGRRYRLDARIDAGAMGVVYRATHLEVGSTVAVKVLVPQAGVDEHAMVRFRREAQLLGQIKHPNAVLVIDFDVEERDGERVAYLVTEFLKGENLRARLKAKGPMRLEETERIITPLADAVEEAHRAGIIHRDLKSSNVFLERLRDGTDIVKVLDFGIAKLIEPQSSSIDLPTLDDALPTPKSQAEAAFARLADESDTVLLGGATISDSGGAAAVESGDGTLTLRGMVLGTLTYMAPEQISGGAVSARTDVYAMASMIFELLTGKLPFSGEPIQIIYQKLNDTRRAPSRFGVEIPKELDQLIERSFALDPEQRPGSVLILAKAVRDAALAGKAPEPLEPSNLSGQLVDLAARLETLGAALEAEKRPTEDSYATLRDQILSLDGPLLKLRAEAQYQQRNLRPSIQRALEGPLAALDQAARRVSRGLNELDPATRPDRREYLVALGSRLLRPAAELARWLKVATPSQTPTPSADLFTDEKESSEDEALEELAQDLESRDLLARSDAFETLLAEHLETLVTRLGRERGSEDPLTATFLRGLWLHADELLLRDLYGKAAGAFRLLPFLAKLRHDAAQPFARLSRCFRRAEGDGAKELARLEPEMIAAGELGASILWRCLLLSPVPEVRNGARRETSLADLWTVISYPKVPIGILAEIFARIEPLAPREYLKIFFLCTREALLEVGRTATVEHTDDLVACFSLLTAYFDVPCYHEDLIFDPLLLLEAELRQAGQAIGLPPGDAHYEALLEAFRAQGVGENTPIERMGDIPLPVQRRLARSGHFLSYFACHPNERVALETVPHLCKREDIVPFLKMPKIHKAVLIELVKEDRLFRKEEPRLALLHNPKTPAHVARRFLPFLSRAQLKLLASSRQIGNEVRTVAGNYLKRLPASTS